MLPCRLSRCVHQPDFILLFYIAGFYPSTLQLETVLVIFVIHFIGTNNIYLQSLDDATTDGIDSKKARIRWISHFEGGMAMMKQAGPQAYQSSLGLEILRSFRPRIVSLPSILPPACFTYETKPHAYV